MRNPHEVFLETTQHLQEVGVTPEVIHKLMGATSEGHKSAQYFLAIIYQSQEGEIR